MTIPDTTRDWLSPLSSSVPRGWTWPIGRSMLPYELLHSGIGRWPPTPNADAGVHESRWLQQNRAQVADADVPWMAILGDQIVVRGATFSEVLEHLRTWNIRDALVACVRPQQEPRPRRIA